MKGYFSIPDPVAKVVSWFLAWLIALFLWFGIPILFFVFVKPLWRPFAATVLYYILLFFVLIKTNPWFERKARELGLVDDSHFG
jgi:apolipoprotein N-acyltransferase